MYSWESSCQLNLFPLLHMIVTCTGCFRVIHWLEISKYLFDFSIVVAVSQYTYSGPSQVSSGDGLFQKWLKADNLGLFSFNLHARSLTGFWIRFYFLCYKFSVCYFYDTRFAVFRYFENPTPSSRSPILQHLLVML